MLRTLVACCLVAALGTFPAGAGAVAAVAPGVLPCARTTVKTRKEPTGPAQYQSGSMVLANGAVLRLNGTSAQLNVARSIAVGDPVAACYGPRTTYADAGPSRTITVLDLANGAYYATLVGTWKPR